MIRSGRATLLALLALALFAFAFHAPALAAAQAAAPVIESAELRLWPEYDDPGLLVIFSGSFPSDASFPMTVSIPVAAGARNIQATYQDSSGSLINRAFEVENGRLTYEIPSGTFHTEYYVDRAPSGDERQIDFTFEAPYTINNLPRGGAAAGALVRFQPVAHGRGYGTGRGRPHLPHLQSPEHRRRREA